MLDKSIPYKDLIMKWDGNRQCLLPVCVPPGYRLRTWREGDQKNWARIQKEAGERSRSFCTPSPGATRLLACI